MICSVRQADGSYVYYDSHGAPKPSTRPALGDIGLGIDQALPALPFGARRMGRGPRARGVLCQASGGFRGLGDPVMAAAAGMPPFYAGLWALVEVAGGLWVLSRYFLR